MEVLGDRTRAEQERKGRMSHKCGVLCVRDSPVRERRSETVRGGQGIGFVFATEET